MRIKLNFQTQGEKVLPINYKYELSSWIYQIISTANADFAEWLHENGYAKGNRKFKFFTFSDLFGFKYKQMDDRLLIESDTISLIISFYVDQAVTAFIEGIFKNQEFELGDKKSRVHLAVRTVERLKDPEWTGAVSVNAISPIIVSKSVKEAGKLKTKYLSPFEEDYEQRLKNNLINKIMARPGNELSRDELEKREFSFRLKNPVKRKKITIKAFTPEQVDLVGYVFGFNYQGDPVFLEAGYYAGFGEKNSLGFGCVKTKPAYG